MDLNRRNLAPPNQIHATSTSTTSQGERVVEVIRPEVEQRILEVPEIHYHERYREVEIPVVHEKITYKETEVIQEREVHVTKPIYEEKIIEVPHYKYVDKIVEVPQVIMQEKIIEVEKVEMIPRDKTEDGQNESFNDVRANYDVPIQTEYRQVPKPVEIPVAFYSAVPVPVHIDRAVPVPVELQVIQDILCPKIEPVYKDIPIPIPVKRTIEKPVPVQAFSNPELLSCFMSSTSDGNATLPLIANPSAPLIPGLAMNSAGSLSMSMQNIPISSSTQQRNS